MPDPTHDLVVVSWLDPRHLPSGAARVLGAEERQRVDADTNPRMAQQRAAASVLLRCVVGSLTGRQPGEVTVSRHCPHCPTPHGRPRLPGSGMQASVSHAGHRVAVAVSDRHAVGVDVEAPRARPLSSPLLRRALTADERKYLLGFPEDQRKRQFLRAWTAKEAILKATGAGLHGGVGRLDLDLLTTPARLRSWAGSPARASTVRLVEMDPGGDHVLTIATIGAETVSVTHREGRTLVQRMTS